MDNEIEERYKRFRETGSFFGDAGGGEGVGMGMIEGEGKRDDDPVGRPWGRFDSKMMRDEGDGEGGKGVGVGPLRVGGRNMI